jgi:hypothetical protein
MWVASLENRLRNTKNDIVITDCRFPNEIKAIHTIGGRVVRVKRGPEPSWYEDADNFNAGQKRVGWALGRDRLKKLGVHASEYSWVGSKFDDVLNNNGTIEELYQQIETSVINNQVQDRLDSILNPLGQFHIDS